MRNNLTQSSGHFKLCRHGREKSISWKERGKTQNSYVNIAGEKSLVDSLGATKPRGVRLGGVETATLTEDRRTLEPIDDDDDDDEGGISF